MKTAEKLLREKYNLKGDRGELRIDQLVVIMNDFGKQLLEEYTNRIVENVEVKVTENAVSEEGSTYTTYDDGTISVTVDEESITSQLPEFLKEKGI
jgi:hypothetical protein